ncbi:hypothetical protein D6856_13505 [Butyrivibrio sp. XB500-5]|uniref:hypothetical protein n=1 Tax=Butyrivibrio sp. XB500-5 TaxID=2364880 RepID=UPI000EA9A433|nr:hypothetical protein [Butyrivibrio sp. XB500-5]RKM57675.1 hypothetical protein D6856_13505 [Butyrivibrio sp. XB500-5]
MLNTDRIIKELYARKLELSQAIARARKDLRNSREGKLRISHSKGSAQYYLIADNGDTRGKYIKKENIKFVKELAQKDYSEKLIIRAEAELSLLDSVIGKLKACDATPESFYSELHIDRKSLISPILLDDEEFEQRWETAEYRTNQFKEEEKIYPTKKGEMVRSKSEVMLADMYYEFGVPYRYESELVLKNGKRVYPDFTLLDKSTRQLVYHEHLGLLDDDRYRLHNLQKLEEYRKNGIYFGKNLLITYEADGCPLNMKDIRKCTKEIFKC